MGATGSESQKPGLPPPWKPTFPPKAATSALAVSDGVPEQIVSRSAPPEPPVERAATEPPPLPEPPERGSARTSIALAEDNAAPRSNDDFTEIVVPLPLDIAVHTAPVRAQRRRWMYAAAAATLFGVAALAVIVMSSSELPKSIATRAPIVAPAPVVVAPHADVIAAAVAQAPDPVEVAPDPTPVVEAKPAVVERAPARKPSARPAKRTSKPKYDPDALFFKGK